MNSSCPQDVTVVGLTLMANPKTVLVVGGTGGVEAFLLGFNATVVALSPNRDLLQAAGVVIEDTPKGARWDLGE